jgi:PKD repeat protein
MKKQLSILGMAFIGCTLLMTSCKKPAASFTADKSTVAVGEAVNFTNGTTAAPKQTWDFGDGTQSTSTGASVSHVYQRPGSYVVSLVGTKKNGKKASDATNVTITVVGATADFTVSKASPAAGEAVTFTSTSTNAEEFDWNFGDGSDLMKNNPVQTHVYSTGGTYNVTLTVYGANHTSVSSKSMDITVGGVSGNNVNRAMMIGTWKYTGKTITDKRNGSTYTSTGGYPSLNYSYTPNGETHEFKSDGSIIISDINGNYLPSSMFNVIDATRMTIGGGAASAYNLTGGASPAYATYVVSATSLVITYVSTNPSLPAYTDYSVTPSVNHPAGEKQVVTTTYTYTK